MPSWWTQRLGQRAIAWGDAGASDGRDGTWLDTSHARYQDKRGKSWDVIANMSDPSDLHYDATSAAYPGSKLRDDTTDGIARQIDIYIRTTLPIGEKAASDATAKIVIIVVGAVVLAVASGVVGGRKR